LNSDRVRDWVSGGGTLIVEMSPNSAPPSWSGISAATSSRDAFSVTGGSPFGAQNGLQKGEAAWSLTGLDQVWGTWDKPTIFSATQNALGYKNYGLGKVIISGTNAFTHSFDPVPGIEHFVFGDENVNETFDYYRMGHNVLVMPTDGSSGSIEIPSTWLSLHEEFYLMNLTSGQFQSTTWTNMIGGRYVFDVPTGNLLLAVVPEPSAAVALMLGFFAFANRRRRVAGKGN
jgi:hypothetical protein